METVHIWGVTIIKQEKDVYLGSVDYYDVYCRRNPSSNTWTLILRHLVFGDTEKPGYKRKPQWWAVRTAFPDKFMKPAKPETVYEYIENLGYRPTERDRD